MRLPSNDDEDEIGAAELIELQAIMAEPDIMLNDLNRLFEPGFNDNLNAAVVIAKAYQTKYPGRVYIDGDNLQVCVRDEKNPAYYVIVAEGALHPNGGLKAYWIGKIPKEVAG